MIVCVQLPRFALTVAAGGPAQLAGRAVAVAPAAGAGQRIGEVSGSAQAAGVRDGMPLGEALARCPMLTLLPEDPVGVAQAWERVLRALEGVGAAVQAPRPGVAYFDSAPLMGLYRDRGTVIATARRAISRPARIGGAPTRFGSLAAALTARSRRARLIDARDLRRYLAVQPVGLLAYHEQTAPLVAPLERLGIATLGALGSLTAAQVADRFGNPGTIARGLALGADEPVRPRRVEDSIEETMRLGELNSGQALARTIDVLIDRLLARRERDGRTVRAVTLSARLVEAGTFSEPVVFRTATAEKARIKLALSTRLPLLPAPPESLSLTVAVWGPAGGDQTSLLDGARALRAARIANAVAQVRTVAGHDAALRVLLVDPDSRVPERRYVFGPYST